MDSESQLLAAARAGIDALDAQPVDRFDLSCEQCSAVLFAPTTLGDGRTVCGPCVAKVRAVDDQRGDTGLSAGFGAAPNVVLDALTQACLPTGHRAAQLRQQGNTQFAAREFEEAATAYAAAVGAEPSDLVSHLNSSAALLKLGRATEAAVAAREALRISVALRHVPTHTMQQKALFRYGAALLQEHGKQPGGEREQQQTLRRLAMEAAGGCSADADTGAPAQLIA